MAEAQEAEKGRPAQSKVRTGESYQGAVLSHPWRQRRTQHISLSKGNTARRRRRRRTRRQARPTRSSTQRWTMKRRACAASAFRTRCAHTVAEVLNRPPALTCTGQARQPRAAGV